ncbi:MAG: hypothetical protein JSV09_00555 [Thermoplasmata archaeon]|nr:MAG: hypothetical protein JSV09_00555 [Thermoplasmata archaeon]
MVRAMEEGDPGDKIGGEESSLLPDEPSEMKVKVIKPFKPSPQAVKVVRQGKCYYHPAKPASYICTSCGKSVCVTCAKNLGEVFFCPQCAPFETQIPPPPPPQETKRDIGWYKALFSIGVILIIIGLIFVLIYWPLTSMSAAEFESLMEEYQKDPDGPGPETGSYNFKDYRPGDVIVIRDKIVRRSIERDPSYGPITRLWFDSTGKDDNDFTLIFDADLERDYHVGDTVSITLHVDEDERTHNEVIREYNNNLPNISNIDHTISIDLVFYAMIIFGVILVVIYYLFTRQQKIVDESRISDSIGGRLGEGTTKDERGPV